MNDDYFISQYALTVVNPVKAALAGFGDLVATGVAIQINTRKPIVECVMQMVCNKN